MDLFNTQEMVPRVIYNNHVPFKKTDDSIKEITESYRPFLQLYLTKDRAERIKEMERKGYGWIIIAEICYREWGYDATWFPSWDKFAGIALCNIAHEVLSETD